MASRRNERSADRVSALHELSGSTHSETPQFGLRTLFLAVTSLCALLGMFSLVSLTWSVAMVVLLALVAAHVGGNALGTHLRQKSSEALTAGGTSRPATCQNGCLPSAARPGEQTPHSLRERRPLGRAIRRNSLLGAAVVGLSGGVLLAVAQWPHAVWSGIVLASLSWAILGAWTGFLASSFWDVLRGALKETGDETR